MVAKSIAKIYTNIHKPTDYSLVIHFIDVRFASVISPKLLFLQHK